MGTIDRGRVQFSVRSLLLMIAAVALLLVPVAWVSRERARLMRKMDAVLLAREVALRSVVMETARRRLAIAGPQSGIEAEASGRESDGSVSSGSVILDQLRRENAALKQENESLHEEVLRIKAAQDKDPQSRDIGVSSQRSRSTP
jgi:hypothetical protein